jgi:hypothetical protein
VEAQPFCSCGDAVGCAGAVIDGCGVVLIAVVRRYGDAAIAEIYELGKQDQPPTGMHFFHIWRVIGQILGVDDTFNQAGFDDGAALWDTILGRQQAPSTAGTALTKGVLDSIREVLPGPAFAGVGPTLIRHLAGDAAADIVDVPPAEITELGVQLGSALNSGYGSAGDAVPIAAKMAGELGLVVFKEGYA